MKYYTLFRTYFESISIHDYFTTVPHNVSNQNKGCKMKKVLLALVLLGTLSMAEESFAAHEAKMQQMQERTQKQDGTGEQKRNKNQNGSGKSGSGPKDGTGNQYKGANGGGGRK